MLQKEMTILCELCHKNEEYHTRSRCNNQHLYTICFNKVHFGINAMDRSRISHVRTDATRIR